MKNIKFIIPLLIVPFISGCSNPAPLSKGSDINKRELKMKVAYRSNENNVNVTVTSNTIVNDGTNEVDEHFWINNTGTHLIIKSLINNKVIVDADIDNPSVKEFSLSPLKYDAVNKAAMSCVSYSSQGSSWLVVFDSFGNELLKTQEGAELLSLSTLPVIQLHSSDAIKNHKDFKYFFDLIYAPASNIRVTKTAYWSPAGIEEISEPYTLGVTPLTKLDEYGLKDYYYTASSGVYHFFKNGTEVSAFDISPYTNFFFMGRYVAAQKLVRVTGDNYDFIDEYGDYRYLTKTVVMDITNGARKEIEHYRVFDDVYPIYNSNGDVEYGVLQVPAVKDKCYLGTEEFYLIDRDLVIRNQVSKDEFENLARINNTLIDYVQGIFTDSNNKVVYSYNPDDAYIAGIGGDCAAVKYYGSAPYRVEVINNLGNKAYECYVNGDPYNSGSDFIFVDGSDADIFSGKTQTVKHVTSYDYVTDIDDLMFYQYVDETSGNLKLVYNGTEYATIESGYSLNYLSGYLSNEEGNGVTSYVIVGYANSTNLNTYTLKINII